MKLLAVATLAAVVLLAVAASSLAVAAPTQKQVPIIGILVSPMEDGCIPPPAWVNQLGPVNGCVESYYVRWLEASGARVVPVPWNATDAHLDYLLSRLNGVLFPGGGMDGGAVLDAYLSTLRRIVNATLVMNEQRNDPMFLWGTCFGFQMMAAAIAQDLGVVTGGFTGMYPLMMPLNFTGNQPTSRLFGDKTTPASVLADLRTLPTTLNWHHAGITPMSWTSSARLMEKLLPLSTNTEPSGKKSFISSYEGRTANIFATQFHPERPPYEFTDPGIGHTAADIAVSQYLSRFIISRAKLNNHAFETPANAEALVVENHPLVYQGYGVESFYIVGDATSKSGIKEFASRR
jgi:gamma-glutamyl hydrolase